MSGDRMPDALGKCLVLAGPVAKQDHTLTVVEEQSDQVPVSADAGKGNGGGFRIAVSMKDDRIGHA